MTKRFLAIFLALLVCVSLFSVMTAAAQPDLAETTSAGDNARYGKCYRVNQSGTYMYVSASTSSGYKYNFPFPTGTLMDFKSASSNGSFYYMSCYYQGSTYTGYVQASRLTEVY